MASGYAAIGAVIVSDAIAKHFEDHTLVAGLTFYAHPTACAAALETMKVYEDEQMYENAERLGPVLRRELDAIAAQLAPATFVRGLGLLGCLEIEPAGAAPGAWAAFSKELAARKLSLHVDGKRGTAIISPPLCISEAELITGVRAFGAAAVAAFGAKRQGPKGSAEDK
jgi:taurine---2-oxoglutarate transaminase